MAALVAVLDVTWPLMLLGAAWAGSLGVLVLLLVGRRRRLGPDKDRRVFILLVAFVVLFGAFGYGFVVLFVTQYVPTNTWSFGYSLSVQGNGTEPASVIVPAVHDEALLSGLRLVSGDANWSLVNTSKGRGLYVHFAGSASLLATVSAFPRPDPLPDTTATLADVANGTTYPNAKVWVFYAGTAAGSFSVGIGDWHAQGYMTPGWSLNLVWPTTVE